MDPKPQRKLHPLPRGLVELYGLLAVLFVLVPEWMADGALAGLRAGRDGSDLPMTTTAWQRIPELRLASMMRTSSITCWAASTVSSELTPPGA